jgi:hypothetical protein
LEDNIRDGLNIFQANISSNLGSYSRWLGARRIKFSLCQAKTWDLVLVCQGVGCCNHGVGWGGVGGGGGYQPDKEGPHGL